MKKILALVAFCFAIMTTQAAVPAPIQEFISEYNSTMAGQSEDGIKFGKAIMEGNDLVIPMYLDDSELAEYGMGLKDAIDLMGGKEAFEEMILLSIFEGEDDGEEIAAFKSYKINLVFRMVGTASKDRVDLRVRYQDL